jgi:hypothetical protein
MFSGVSFTRRGLGGAVLCLALFFTPWIFAQTRLAILGDTEKNRAEADCALERFSKIPGVEMVERSEIDKIIAERKLSALSGEDAINLGKMAGAKGLIIIKSFEWQGKNILSARLVATESGAVLGLWIQDTPSTEAFHFADAVKFEFEPLLSKLNPDRDGVTALSILDIRAAVDSPEAKKLERDLTLLLSQRLMREKSLIVLERWRLSNTAWEKTLNLDQNRFWTGSFILDGSVQPPDGKGDIKVTLRLLKPGQKEPILAEVTGPASDLLALTEKMALAVREKLGVAADSQTGSWDTRKEADFYFNEAQWLLRAGSHERAREASDAAATLGKTGPEIDFLRIKSYLGELGRGHKDEPKDTEDVPLMGDLDKIAQALDIYIKFVERDPKSLKTNVMGDSDWRLLGNSLIRKTADLLQQYAWVLKRQRNMRTETKMMSKAKIVRSLARQAVKLTMEKGDDAPSMEHFYNTYLMSLLELVSSSPEEFESEYRKILLREFPKQPGMHYHILIIMDRKLKSPNPRLLTDIGGGKHFGLTWVNIKKMLERLSAERGADESQAAQIDALVLAGKKADPDQISDILWENRDRIINGEGGFNDAPQALLFCDNCPRGAIVKLVLHAFSQERVILGDPAAFLMISLNHKKQDANEEDNRKVAEAWSAYLSKYKGVKDTRKVISRTTVIKEQIGGLSGIKTAPKAETPERTPVLAPLTTINPTAFFTDDKNSRPEFLIEDIFYSDGCTQIAGWFMDGAGKSAGQRAFLFCCPEDGSGPVFTAAPARTSLLTPCYCGAHYPFHGRWAGIMLRGGENIYYIANEGDIQVKNKDGEWKKLADTGFKKATAATFSDGKLYAAYGYIRGFGDVSSATQPTAIVQVDTKTGEMKILASNRRNPPESVLDNCPPWYAYSMACSDNGVLISRAQTVSGTADKYPYSRGLYEFDTKTNHWRGSKTGRYNGIFMNYGYSGNILNIFPNCVVFDMESGKRKTVDSSPLGSYLKDHGRVYPYDDFHIAVITTDNGEKTLRVQQLNRNFFRVQTLGIKDGLATDLKFQINPENVSSGCNFLRKFAASKKTVWIALGAVSTKHTNEARIFAFDINAFLKPAGEDAGSKDGDAAGDTAELSKTNTEQDNADTSSSLPSGS